MIIYKQQMNSYGLNTVRAPRGAKFLSVQIQRGCIQVWYSCDPHNVVEEYHLQGFVTGTHFHLPDDAEYLGTLQFQGGDFIMHFYIWKQDRPKAYPPDYGYPPPK